MKVYTTKAKIISFGSSESIKTLNRRVHWGKEGIVYQHDPRHIDVLVKELGLENGNTVQTPAAPNATEEEESESLSQTQHHKLQITGCQMFVPQSRSSRHNIHCERVMPDDVKPHSTELCQAKKTHQISETREAVGSNFQVRENR